MGRSQWKGQQGRCHDGSLLEIEHSREEVRSGRSVQSRRFLQCVEENCLTQLVTEPVRAGVPLDLFVD